MVIRASLNLGLLCAGKHEAVTVLWQCSFTGTPLDKSIILLWKRESYGPFLVRLTYLLIIVQIFISGHLTLNNVK